MTTTVRKRRTTNSRNGSAAKKDSTPKGPTTKRSHAQSESPDIERIVKKIHELQETEGTGKLDVIQARIEIGAEFIKLKEAVAHGEWDQQRDQLEYDERTAQRLMKLSSENFGDKIRNLRPDLAHRLPIDVVKLDRLNGLSAKQLQTCLTKNNFETMKRSEVRDIVQKVVDPEGARKAQKQRVSASKTKRGASAKNTPAAPLGDLQEFCQHALDLKAAVAQRIEKNEVGKRYAVQTVKEIDKAIEALRNMKKRLGAVAK